jgi:uncharacterized protein (DUF58 family)
MAIRLWGVIAFLGVVLGVLASNAWLLVFALGSYLVIGGSYYWSQHVLEHVHYRRRWIYRRGFPGETTDFHIEVVNDKRLPVAWLRVSDPWPANVGVEQPDALEDTFLPDLKVFYNLYRLRWYERVVRDYSLKFQKRGVHAVGPARLEAGDLFGMFEEGAELKQQEYLTVFPALLEATPLQLNADDPFGDRQARRTLFEDPNRPIGVRPYQPGDSFRHVHWPATARTGSLQTRVFQQVSSRVMMICMNVATDPKPWLNVDTELLEYIIRLTATMVYQGAGTGYAVGLLSNGYLAQADQPFNIPPNRSPGQLALLLESLAAVTSFTTTPFESYLTASLPRVQYGTTLVVVSALVTEALCQTLLRLKRYRTYTTLISLQAEPPPALPGIRTVHLPYPLRGSAEREKA